MILVMPLPHILKPMTTSIAKPAMSQFLEQFVIALAERVRPMAMMMGPVTIGGKKRMTFFVPNILKKADRMTYISPATATPTQAYGSSSLSPLGAIAKYPARNAKDEPRNAGTLPLVMRWNSRVPRPANSSVAETLSPVRVGTSTVAPNIANIC